MEINLQGKYAHTANMMIKQLKTGEITLEEYLMKCAYWGVKTMDDVYFKSLPSKPLEVIEYEHLSYSKRDRLTKEYYKDNPGVLKYYEDKDRILRNNKDSLLRLKEYKKYIPESDVKNREKLDEKITDFKRMMEGY